MGHSTNIEWCDSTINPTSGCDGCELWNGKDIRDCYAGNLHENRLAKTLPMLYDAEFQNVRMVPGRMKQAAQWADLRGKDRPNKPWLNGLPRMIFVGDMGDFLSKAITDDYIQREIVDVITSREGKRHFWLLLTKQIARLKAFSHSIGGLPDNCMAMTTVTNQHTANVRVKELIDVQCKWRGISAEPLFELVDFDAVKLGCGYRPLSCGCSVECDHPTVDWVITGGLSGSNAAPADPRCFYSLRDQCKHSNTPFFFKQYGEWGPVAEIGFGDYQRAKEFIFPTGEASSTGIPFGISMLKVGKKAAGCSLNGIEYKEFPAI